MVHNGMARDVTPCLCLWCVLPADVARIHLRPLPPAYTIDRKWMGRKRLQAMGFLMM